MKRTFKYIFIIFLLVAICATSAYSITTGTENWRLNEITLRNDNFLEKSDGDPFIVFPEINESTCAPMGVQLSISFKPLPKKPILLEVFWSTDYLGFGEENKVFFVLHPNKDSSPNNIIVPLGHTAGFRQIRLDFPSYIDTAFKVENYSIVPLSSPTEDYQVVDAYYNLSIEESLKPEILIPYLLKAIAHGPQRLTHDLLFLVFWSLLIVVLLFLIRFSAKKINRVDTVLHGNS